jgi:hypothetical protein
MERTMSGRAKRGFAIALAVALALPFSSPLRELSRRTSVCPLDLDVVIERVFAASTPASVRARPLSSVELGVSLPRTMAEHGVASDPTWRLTLRLAVARVLPTSASTLPPPLPDVARSEQADIQRPTRRESTPPPPVRGPPAPQV